MNLYNQPPHLCIHCDQPTDFGSGRFVNRIPGDSAIDLPDGTKEYRDGFACSECMMRDCERCGKPIPMDEDISPEGVYGEDTKRDVFDDGTYCLHEECLTDKEKAQYKITWEL